MKCARCNVLVTLAVMAACPLGCKRAGPVTPGGAQTSALVDDSPAAGEPSPRPFSVPTSVDHVLTCTAWWLRDVHRPADPSAADTRIFDPMRKLTADERPHRVRSLAIEMIVDEVAHTCYEKARAAGVDAAGSLWMTVSVTGAGGVTSLRVDGFRAPIPRAERQRELDGRKDLDPRVVALDPDAWHDLPLHDGGVRRCLEGVLAEVRLPFELASGPIDIGVSLTPHTLRHRNAARP
jgi:hypothetical protein